jgi:hypothetical protein
VGSVHALMHHDVGVKGRAFSGSEYRLTDDNGSGSATLQNGGDAGDL